MKVALKTQYIKIKKHSWYLCKWLWLSLLTGVFCGGLGCLFAKSIVYVTGLRSSNSWLLYLLPVGGLLSVGIYHILQVEKLGTNQILESARSDKNPSFWLAPAIFSGAVITHLCGGSAGKEGAALQLGGSVAGLLAKAFRLKNHDKCILVQCGMGAFFSAVFGTPMGAAIFALEVVRVGRMRIGALFPTFASSITAYVTAALLGGHAERFPLEDLPALTPGSAAKAAMIAVAGAFVSILFCKSLQYTKAWFSKIIKNSCLRIAAGGAILIGLSVLLGTTDYNGGGTHVITRIFTLGEVRYEAFLLKIIFTAITVAAGYKGGEIVPTLFIGATMGGTLALLMGLSPTFGAAIGMVALFCGVTNCPLASVFLAGELFGTQGLLFFAIASVISFVLSGKVSLYTAQEFFYDEMEASES